MIDSETEFVIAGIVICVGYIALTVRDKLKNYLYEK